MYVCLFVFSLRTSQPTMVDKLHMMGYDMGWASFHVVEVMSAPRIHLKTIGYLAAAESFKEDTDVLMLTTNLLKKVRDELSDCMFVS